ncbi:MAG: DMT family transporter [Aquabacterium sp.]
MSHGRAVALMVLATLMWSIAGVVSRFLESARPFEVTFWRSAFNAAALLVVLLWLRGGRGLVQALRNGGWPLWVSGLCWMTMFTNFMLAITMTSVASVLVIMASTPLVTALFSRLFLGHRLPTRTWAAIVLAGCGIAWMFALDAAGGEGSYLGVLVAAGVPLAAATNWTLLQWVHQHRTSASEPEMLPAVWIGALLSALLMLPMSLPFAASAHDIQLLALLGVVQLCIPCLLAVHLAKWLPAPELALLGLLEVILGVLWTWIWAGETPAHHALTGGALVIAALVGNELLGLRRAQVAATN